MRATKEITLKIYCDKEEEFYLSLFKCKSAEKPDSKAFKSIMDAIHFDSELIFQGMVVSENQLNRINAKLLSTHQYLLNSKKNSDDYITVGKENFEQFITSPFAAELIEIFKISEILRQWLGKENAVEAKISIALLSLIIQGLGEAIADGLAQSYTTSFALNELQKKAFEASINKKGNLIYGVGGEEKQVELQLYYEQNGEITKLNLKNGIELIPELNPTNSLYYYNENRAYQLKQIADEIQTICYENISVKGNKLDISKATITQTFTQNLKAFYSRNISEKNGNYIIHPYQPELNNLNEHTNSSIKVNTPVPVDILKIKDHENSVFTPIEKIITPILKIPTNKSEEVENRENITIKIFSLLQTHYPQISPHVSKTITGYILFQLGLLDNEEQHDRSKRNQPYLKYLRDTVHNTLKKKSLL